MSSKKAKAAPRKRVSLVEFSALADENTQLRAKLKQAQDRHDGLSDMKAMADRRLAQFNAVVDTMKTETARLRDAEQLTQAQLAKALAKIEGYRLAICDQRGLVVETTTTATAGAVEPLADLSSAIDAGMKRRPGVAAS